MPMQLPIHHKPTSSDLQALAPNSGDFYVHGNRVFVTGEKHGGSAEELAAVKVICFHCSKKSEKTCKVELVKHSYPARSPDKLSYQLKDQDVAISMNYSPKCKDYKDMKKWLSRKNKDKFSAMGLSPWWRVSIYVKEVEGRPLRQALP